LDAIVGKHNSRKVRDAMAAGEPIPEATALLWVCAGVAALGVLLGATVIITL
jgi:hypothetical protein